MIEINDIKEGARFKTKTGIIWNIDKVTGELVETSMEDGRKGNYRDAVKTVVEFLNEQKAVKIN